MKKSVSVSVFIDKIEEMYYVKIIYSHGISEGWNSDLGYLLNWIETQIKLYMDD